MRMFAFGHGVDSFCTELNTAAVPAAVSAAVPAAACPRHPRQHDPVTEISVWYSSACLFTPLLI